MKPTILKLFKIKFLINNIDDSNIFVIKNAIKTYFDNINYEIINLNDRKFIAYKNSFGINFGFFNRYQYLVKISSSRNIIEVKIYRDIFPTVLISILYLTLCWFLAFTRFEYSPKIFKNLIFGPFILFIFGFLIILFYNYIYRKWKIMKFLINSDIRVIN